LTFKFKLVILIIFVFSALFCPLGLISSADEYVYYGTVPSRIYYAKPRGALPGQGEYDLSKGFTIDPSSIADYGLLCIAAVENDTIVRVYEMPSNRLMSECRLNEMGKYFVKIPNGTLFKVVSNKILSVLLVGGNVAGRELEPSLPEAPVAQTFYTSTRGSFVGKEFIFIACQGLTDTPFKIIALEDADVTVMREDGWKLTFKMQANSYKVLQLVPFRAYRVKATGNIMIQSGRMGGRYTRSLFIPTPQGGFMGTIFYTAATTRYWPASDDGFRISSLEDAKVEIWDVETKSLIQRVIVRAGMGVSVKPRANVILVRSDKPIMLEYINNGTVGREFSYGAGVTYFTIKPNEETVFFLPTNSTVQTYIFAYKETVATIDDVPIKMPADSYYTITTGGFHRIRSNRELIVQLIHWPLTPPFQGIESFGTIIPCAQTISIKPKVRFTSLRGEGFPLTYLVVAVISIGVIVAVMLFMRKYKRGI